MSEEGHSSTTTRVVTERFHKIWHGRPLAVRRSLYALLPVLVVAWIANYLHFSEFGFYEDDWYFFAPPYLVPTSLWFRIVLIEVRNFVDGRPFHFAEMHLLGYIGAATSSISLLYLICFALLAASAVLLHCVLRATFPSAFCTITTLIYLLSPLITLKQFLNGELTFGPALICAFLAILLYRTHLRPFSYLAGIVALLTYEPTFLLFVVAPLLQQSGPRHSRYRLRVTHAAVCLLIVGVCVTGRLVLGQTRQLATISDLSIAATTRNLFLYDGFFTVSSLESYIYAFYVGVREISLESATYCGVFILFLTAFLFRDSGVRRIDKAFAAGRFGRARRWWWISHGIFGGLVFTIIGYSLSYFTLYHDWLYPLSGRDTRVSATASIGSSMLLAALMILVIGVCRDRWARRVARLGVVGVLAGLFLYSFVVQRDYVTDWAHQRNFLTQLMMLSPDVHADTLFIVKVPWLTESLLPGSTRRPSIGYQAHGLQVSLRQIFGFDAPQIFVVYSDEWRKYLQLKAGKLYWTQTVFPGGWGRSTTEPITPGHVIVMEEYQNGDIRRLDAPILVGTVPTQITQAPQPLERMPESNWTSFSASPLLDKVIPQYVSEAVMMNAVDRSFQVVRETVHVIKLAVKWPAVEEPFRSGLSEPLVITGKPGAGDFVEVHYYGHNSLRLRIDHWGIPGVESALMNYDPDKVYFVDVLMGRDMSATIAGWGIAATFNIQPFPAGQGDISLGRNPIGGGITTEAFSGEIVAAQIVR
jgi:hypothetical protein